MSSKVMSVLGAVIMGVALLAGTTQGCGGSSGGGANIADICMRGCTKTLSCVPAGTITQADCQAMCMTRATTSSGAHCANESALVAKNNECLAKPDCAMFLQCALTIPPCEGGGAGGTTGTAGTRGTGGTTGTAGTRGTAGTGSTGAAGFSFDASIPNFDANLPFDANFGFDLGGFIDASAGSTCSTACLKADDCCKALPNGSAASCTFQTMCSASANPAQSVQACNLILTGAAALGAATPAACK